MFFRNPEIKKQLLLFMAVSMIFTAGAFFLGLTNGFYVLFVCVFFGIFYFGFTGYRYKRIGELSEKLNGILHGNENLNMLSHGEGELAVLTSEIYKATLRLREQAEQLENDKVYLKDFIADISHQIKTPMTSLHLILLRLEGDETEWEERIFLLRKMQNLLERMDWLVAALLKIASIESDTVEFQKEKVSVGKVVEKAIEHLQIPMELKDIKYISGIDGKCWFWGDPGWSVEAFANILKNCVEHSAAGGNIEIQTEDNPLFTGISISDDGECISKEDLPHIFERFYKGKNTDKESYGIGLALANMIIQKQGGKITVKNREESKGVCFEIRFYKGAV